MDKPIDIANLRPVLEKVLQSFQLTAEEVKAGRSKMDMYGRGRFFCATCDHSWTSAFSWLTFDLRELKVKKLWTMKCKYEKCKHAECKPEFTFEQLEAMFRVAVRRYKGEDSNPVINIGYSARRNTREPHYPVYCEKCEWGATCCWIRPRGIPLQRPPVFYNNGGRYVQPAGPYF